MKKTQIWLYTIVLCFMPFFFSCSVLAEPTPTIWNTVPLIPAPPNIVQRIKQSVSSIVSVSWDEIPKDLGIDFLGIQGDYVLIEFERTAKRKTHVCVFDVAGNYLYGYRFYKHHDSAQLALSPIQEGILILDWRVSKISYPGILVLRPDQIAEYCYYYSENSSGINDYPIWESEYALLSSINGKVIISNKDTGETRTIVDYSAEYLQTHPEQTKEWAHKKLLNDRFALLLVVLVTCCGSIAMPLLAKKLRGEK